MTSQDDYPKPSVAWFAVMVLMIAYTISFIDRLILSLLVEPIKEDLQLSDFEISLLQGFSFAVFYTLAGIPIGRLVDSTRRTGIIAVGVALWSLMTALCALTQHYWQLFMARAGVGVGEATLAPAAYSLITDLFPRHRLGLALGIFSSGASVGAGLALIIGGFAVEAIARSGVQSIPLVGELEPWRLTFLYVGLPGLLVALLVLTIPEPVRRLTGAKAEAATTSVPYREVFAHYRRHGSAIGLHHLAMSFGAMGSYGIMAWAPVMLMRTHGFTPQEAGMAIGASILIAGTIGVIGGGWFGDELTRRGQKAGRLNAACISTLIGLAGSALYPLQTTTTGIVIFFMLTMLGAFMTIGGSAAALLEIMPNRLRGQATAVYFFVISLLGIGAGPTVVASITDFVLGDPALVRYSLLVAPTTAYALSALGFWLARKPYVRSIESIAN